MCGVVRSPSKVYPLTEARPDLCLLIYDFLCALYCHISLEAVVVADQLVCHPRVLPYQGMNL